MAIDSDMHVFMHAAIVKPRCHRRERREVRPVNDGTCGANELWLTVSGDNALRRQAVQGPRLTARKRRESRPV